MATLLAAGHFPIATVASAADAATTKLVSSEERSRHFAAVNKHLELGGELYGYVDIDGDVADLGREISKTVGRFVGMNPVLAENPALAMAQQDYAALFGSLGLADVKAIGLSSVSTPVGYRNNVFLYTPEGRQGLLAMVGDQGIDVAVNLDVPEYIVVERISSRRVCSNCGTIYSVDAPPATPGVCDRCGGEVIQRDDDTEAAVLKRLAIYNEQTEPLLAWFDERGLLVTVDGVGAPDAITEQIVSVIDDRLA